MGKIPEPEVLPKFPRCDELGPGYPHLAASQVEVLDGARHESIHHHGHTPAERGMWFLETLRQRTRQFQRFASTPGW